MGTDGPAGRAGEVGRFNDSGSRRIIMSGKIGFLLLITILLAACSPTGSATPAVGSMEPSASTAEGATPITLIDDLGRTVVLAAPAQRVVSLAPANTEILFAVGAGGQVVGRDETSDFPADALALPTIGGYSGFNLEAIVALHPDLVLAQGGGFNSPELVASLEELGLTVFSLPNPTSMEGMFTNLETVALLTGHEQEVETLLASLRTRVAAVDEKIMPLSYAPTVYYELDATEPSKPFTAGPGTFVDLLISRAGGLNIGSALEGQWAQISLEQLVVANPAMIILGDAAYGETSEKVSQRPGWEMLTAIQTGQVFPIDDNLVSRPGPRLVDGLEALARLLHPGVFK